WGSGPRGGLEGGMAYARHYHLPTVIAMDIGGTTTDVSIIQQEAVSLRPYGAIEALTTSFPLPKLQSFGLGGSSIVKVLAGQIHIGPESVGAVPGPACFGRGGTSPTLTDALLLARVLDPERYLGGELKLSHDRAAHALQAEVGAALGCNAEAAAQAVITAFQTQVGARLKKILTAAGVDPNHAALLAFGGGGPIIASGVARAMGIKRVIIPRLASVFSAFGIGFSHLAHEYQVPLTDAGSASIVAIKQELAVRARRDMAGEGVDPDRCEYRYSLWSAGADSVVEEALDEDQSISRADPRATLKAIFELPVSSLAGGTPKISGTPVSRGGVEVLVEGRAMTLAIYNDQDLKPGHSVDGACLVKGDYLTCLVDPGWRLSVTGNQDLMLEESRS
ncbi:MAG: hydantoinase/oxoprolinase family protein, partial [Gammaproteobacteria bacterium]